MASLSLSCVGEGNGNPLQCSCQKIKMTESSLHNFLFRGNMEERGRSLLNYKETNRQIQNVVSSTGQLLDLYQLLMDLKKGRVGKRRRQWHPTPVLLPGKSHGWRSLVGCSPWGHEESDTTERLHFHVSLSCTGEGNGNPLQCSCLENPRDRGAW